MLYRTHVITSVTAAVALTSFDNVPLAALTIAGVALGSLLPDIDEPASYIGSRTRGISDITKMFFGHRGFTHSIAAIFLAFLPWFLIQSFLAPTTITTIFAALFLGVGIGYAFHIAGDFFSKTGVPLLLPFSKKKFKIYLYVTGGTRELFIRYASVACLIYLIFTGIF